MDRLNDLKITNADGDIEFDFAHFSREFFTKRKENAEDRIIDGNADFINDNGPIVNANLRFIQDQLGINKVLYRLDQVYKNTRRRLPDGSLDGGSGLIKEKYDRAKIFKDLVSNFSLEIIMILYWIDLDKMQKSTIGLKRSLDFAIHLGTEMVRLFEKRLDEEYNQATILEDELGIKYKKGKK